MTDYRSRSMLVIGLAVNIFLIGCLATYPKLDCQTTNPKLPNYQTDCTLG